MGFADNQGTRIHYETFGDVGLPALVLVHGFTQDLRLWQEHGYIDALKDRFYVIAVDVRGHGQSDRPEAPKEYTLDILVSDIVAVLDVLDIPAAHYLGYSMGGRIGAAVAFRAADRLLSATLVGSSYYDKGYTAFRDVDSGDANGFADALTVLTGEVCDAPYRWLLRATGVASYVALGKQAIEESNLGYETPQIPMSYVVGALDDRAANVKRMAAETNGIGFVVLDGENHESSISRVGEIVQAVRANVVHKG